VTTRAKGRATAQKRRLRRAAAWLASSAAGRRHRDGSGEGEEHHGDQQGEHGKGERGAGERDAVAVRQPDQGGSESEADGAGAVQRERQSHAAAGIEPEREHGGKRGDRGAGPAEGQVEEAKDEVPGGGGVDGDGGAQRQRDAAGEQHGARAEALDPERGAGEDDGADQVEGGGGAGGYGVGPATLALEGGNVGGEAVEAVGPGVDGDQEAGEDDGPVAA